MEIVVLTAFVVGASTMIGSLFSFFFKEIPHKMSDAILSFAAGIMLAATFFSLIMPALEYKNGVIMSAVGILLGALLISAMDRFVPHIHNLINVKDDANSRDLSRITLFLIAIAIHNFPEGMAVGVSFGSENMGNAISIAIGISLQNIPEGMITILPLVIAGVSKPKALIIAFVTGSTEIIGVLLGYFMAGISVALLPLILSLAGGTMLYVISHDMIPETHSHGYENTSTFSLVFGVIAMVFINSVAV